MPGNRGANSLQGTEFFEFCDGFDEGDVELIISPAHRVRIDAAILKCASRFFAASLGPKCNWQGGNDRDDIPDSRGVRWTYVLELDETDPLGDIFKRQSSTVSTRYEPGVDRDIWSFRALENLFLIFCHRIPNFTGLDDCQALIELGDKYDCLPYVSQAIQIQLLESPDLKRRIRTAPNDFLVLVGKLRSPTLLRKAAKYAMRQWVKPSTDGLETSSTLSEMLKMKRSELDAFREHVRSDLFLITTDRDQPVPEFLDDSWIAISLVREGIAKAFENFKSKGPAERSDGILYRCLLNLEHFTFWKRVSKHNMALGLDFYNTLDELACKVRNTICELVREHSQSALDEGTSGNQLHPLIDEGLPWDDIEDRLSDAVSQDPTASQASPQIMSTCY
ncbi:MAG: hypothetical protein M1840_009002 [Geoglossum simile]|nr:MAG: hypothetical protein M1840_009002 [Geoglossum simile]